MSSKRDKKKKTKQTPKDQNEPIADMKSLGKPMTWISLFILLIATSFVYRSALDNDFVDWDDFTYVIDNELVRSSQDMEPGSINRANPSPHATSIGDVFRRAVSSNYHPLTILTMRWNNNVCADCVYGISARPFIFWNIFLHLLNTLFVFLLIMQLSRNHLLTSLGIAAIFALHPMHVESVAWVSERKDVLYSFFFISGLLSYLKFLERKEIKWWFITFILFVLSCFSKGMAVVFPLAMLLIYWYKKCNQHSLKSFYMLLSKPALLPTLPFFIVSLIFGLLAFRIQSGHNFLGILERTSDIVVAVNEFDAFSIWQRFQFASYGFIQYLMKFFAPVNLSTYYTYPTQVQYDDSIIFTAAPFFVLGFIGLTIYSLNKTKSILFGMAFFMVTIVLVLQFISVGTVIMADRYTYLPYIGLSIAFVFPFLEFASKKTQAALFAILGVWIISLSYKTINQIETWANSDTLWTNVIETGKHDNGVLHETMAMPYATRGSYYGKMSEYYGRIKNDPGLQNEYLNKAASDFGIAKQLNTQDARVYKGLGNVAGIQGSYTEALAMFSKAIELDPTDHGSFFNRGVTLANIGEYDKAIEDYSQSLTLTEGRSIGALVNRGLAYKALGQIERARGDFNQVLRMEPTNSYAKQQLDSMGN